MLITDPIERNESPEPKPGNSHIAEAYENLRVIRDVMDRSTKHSTLSGFSGILVGIWAILGVFASAYTLKTDLKGSVYAAELVALGSIWLAVLGLSAATDFVFTKSRAVRVGKQVFSNLGVQMIRAAAPGFVTCLLITFFFALHQNIQSVWPYWMLCYGIAICSVGQFSVREVSWLGWGFILLGAIALAVPMSLSLTLLAAGFGGLHIIYGLYTGITRRDW
jgi:hypothetical protein